MFPALILGSEVIDIQSVCEYTVFARERIAARHVNCFLSRHHVCKKRFANGPLQFSRLFRCNRWERILRVIVIFLLEMCHQKDSGRLTNTECKPMFDRSLIFLISTGMTEMTRIYHGEIEPTGSTRFPYQAQGKKAIF